MSAPEELWAGCLIIGPDDQEWFVECDPCGWTATADSLSVARELASDHRTLAHDG